MRRIAFFVEGYSEMLFVERLVSEVAGAHNVLIHQMKIRGGATIPKYYAIVQAAREATNENFYVLIFDCGGDKLVASRIREEHEGLTQKGYEKIIGLRDVRPDYSREQVARLERGLRMYIKTSLAPVEFILSTMELEAWFLAEFNHFSKIDPAITPDSICEAIGYHPRTDDPALRDDPASDLNISYGLAGKSYSKADVKNTIDVLDFAYIYTELKDRIPPLRCLTNHIDDFLSPSA